MALALNNGGQIGYLRGNNIGNHIGINMLYIFIFVNCDFVNSIRRTRKIVVM